MTVRFCSAVCVSPRVSICVCVCAVLSPGELLDMPVDCCTLPPEEVN